MSIHRPTPARRAVRAAALVTVGVLVLVAWPALPAMADVPTGWPEPEPVPLLHALLIYLFAPLGLLVLIALLTITPSLVRGERPGVGAPDDQWFGGPRNGTRELESGTTTEPGTTKTGGASGGW